MLNRNTRKLLHQITNKIDIVILMDNATRQIPSLLRNSLEETRGCINDTLNKS